MRKTSIRCMKHLIRHDLVEWAVECKLLPTHDEIRKLADHTDIEQFRSKHSKVFNDIPLRR